MNNFKKLAEEKMDKKSPPKRVEKNVKGTIGVFELVSNIVELFIPKVVNVWNDMLGGEHEDQYEKMNASGKFEDKQLPQYPNNPHLNQTPKK